jgi:hypothetical protein
MDAKNPQPMADKKAVSRSRTAPPDEFANPAGVGGEVCDVDDDAVGAEPCDPTEAEDLVLEESKPGYGISGYEGEEVGGG